MVAIEKGNPVPSDEQLMKRALSSLTAYFIRQVPDVPKADSTAIIAELTQMGYKHEMIPFLIQLLRHGIPATTLLQALKAERELLSGLQETASKPMPWDLPPTQE